MNAKHLPRVILAALLACTTLPAAAAPLPAGAPAPDFTRPGFDGRPVSLSAVRGKLVLLDFWASWCAPCMVELPHLIDLQRSHAGRLQIIGVSMDDNKSSAVQAIKSYPVNYPLVMGDAAIGKLYGGVLGLPEIFLIGRDGKILKSWRGDFKPGEVAESIAAAEGKAGPRPGSPAARQTPAPR